MNGESLPSLASPFGTVGPSSSIVGSNDGLWCIGPFTENTKSKRYPTVLRGKQTAISIHYQMMYLSYPKATFKILSIPPNPLVSYAFASCSLHLVVNTNTGTHSI